MSDQAINTLVYLDQPTRMRNHAIEVMLETLNYRLKRLQNTGERAVEDCRALQESKVDISEEADELVNFARGLLLSALLIQHQNRSE